MSSSIPVKPPASKQSIMTEYLGKKSDPQQQERPNPQQQLPAQQGESGGGASDLFLQLLRRRVEESRQSQQL
jgi:hypothetical protein